MTTLRRIAVALALLALAFAHHVQAAVYAYVTAGTSLYIIDAETNRYVGDPIALVPVVSSGNIAVSPGGRFVYVLMRTGLQSQPGNFEGAALAIVDTAAARMVGSVTLRSGAHGVIVAPDGDRVYVANGSDAALVSTSVSIVSPRDGTVIATVPIPSMSGGIATTPDGLSVVVTTDTGLAVLDTRSNALTRTITLLGQPKDVVISPDGAIAYVSARFTGGLDAGAVLYVSLSDGSIRRSVPVMSNPSTLAISPDGTRLYLVDATLRGVQVINVPLAQGVTAIPLGVLPTGLAVTPTGDKLFVTKLGGPSVTVIATGTNAIDATIVGPNTTASAQGTHFLGPMGSATPYVVEYFHAGFGHYFLTNNSIEMEKLDTTPDLGWARTGQRFGVYTVLPPGTMPVCRFFTIAFGAKSSHFYAPRGFGCESTLANKDWKYEGDVFSMTLPDAGGACAAGTFSVYRMYNNGQGGAPNHRYSSDPSIRAQMLAQGWIPEGAGIGVGMCAPSP